MYNMEWTIGKEVPFVTKRIFCAALAMIMLMGAICYAEEEKTPDFTMAGFDDTNYRDWETNLFFERLENITGVTFAYQQFKKADEWQAYKDGLTRDGEKADVLFKAGLSTSECIRLYEEGVLVDLKPYLQECCPALYAYLQEHPDVMDAITLPGGQIVALPYITETPVQNYIWVNTTWLKRVGKEMPANVQEMEEVLVAFRDMDPNRNGRADEVPLGFMGPFDLKFLAHGFGLVANDYNIYVEDGQVKYLPLEKNFRPFVEWCRKLYAEGLLEDDGFMITTSMRTQRVAGAQETPMYGMIITPMAQDAFRVDYADEYEIMMPLAYEGKQQYRDYTGTVLRGTFAVTCSCDQVEKVLEWVDYLYTPEGNILATAGKEGESFYFNPDGTWSLSETTAGNTYFSITDLISGGATAPGLLNDAFQRRYADSKKMLENIASQDEFKQYLVMPYPYYHLTKEQAAFIAPLQMELGAYVDTMMGQFIRGDVELNDQTWAQFETTLYDMGVTEFIAFWQQILEAR